jgi:hypothetical protein
MPGTSKYELAEIQKGLEELELREKHPLRVYRPTEFQLPVHESPASEVLTIGGKRSGKTIAVVMEFASRILGMPIIRQDGTEIPLRFRKPSKRNPGLYWVIGFDINHIGQTIYHRLFSPGLGDGANFRIIRDLETGKWRAYNPNYDRERYNDSELSPPLFGDHMIVPKSWHMESAAGNVFRSVRLTNGVTLCAYPSTGDSPKKGDAVDGIWIDEDIEKGSFLKEWQDRLTTTCGWFLWSVWPQVANEALIETLDRAEREKDNPEKPIEVFRLVGSDNPYSDRKGIQQMLARMDDDDDEAHRNQGDISAFISGRQMYSFGAAIHIVKPEPREKPDGAMQQLCNLLAQDPTRLPKDWTRYLVIDPSHTRTACLVGVVPPPEFLDLGNRLIIEEEIILRKHTPAMFADVVRQRVGGFRFEAFIMDQMIGRQTTVASDVTVFQAYDREFRQRGLVSRVSKSGFIRGCNDKALRRRCVRDLMEPTEGGWPRLLFSVRCPSTIKEVRNFRKKEVKDPEGNPVPTDDGESERLYDCVMCVEYLGEYIANRFRDGTAYVAPEYARSTGSIAYHAAQAMISKIKQKEGGEYAHLGPGEAA